MTKARNVALAACALVLVLGAGTAAAAIAGDDRTGGTTAATATSSTDVTSTDATSTDVTSTGASSTATSTPASSTEDRPTTGSTEPTAPRSPGVDNAIRIALQRVGGGRVAGVEQELEHGRVEWKIRIDRDGTRYDVRVDAGTGTVTRVEVGRHGDQATPTRGNDDGRDRDRDRDDHSGSGHGGHGGDDGGDHGGGSGGGGSGGRH